MIFKLISGFKKFSFISVAILCAAFLSCATTFSVSNSVAIPEDFFGISPDSSTLNDEDCRFLDDFNATWIRTTIRWTSVEPQQGKWDFDHWDNYLANAEAAGKKVILILGFDNGWLFKDNKERRRMSKNQFPLFLNYVEQVVRRYGTRAVYEIWNEPNAIYWKGPKRDFFELSAAAVKKIREVEPEAVILAGSTFFVDRGFTRGLFKAGAMEDVDGFSVHPYGISPGETIKQYNQLLKIFKEFNYDGFMWITEVGYFTGPRPLFSLTRYPEYIVKTLSSLAIRADRVRNMIWYEMMNHYNPGEEKDPLNVLNYLGLMYPNRTFKPGADAFILTANFIAGSEYNPELPLREGVNRNITGLYFLKEDGTSVLIIWNDGSGKRNLRLTVPDAENLSRHNIHNREITALSDGTVLEIRREPVFITWNGGGQPRLFN